MRPVNFVGIGPRGRFSSFLNPGLAPFFPLGGAGGPKSRARGRRPGGPSPGGRGPPKPPPDAGRRIHRRASGPRTRSSRQAAWPAGPRSAVAPAPAVAARARTRRRAAILAGACFADGQRPAHEELTVEALDRVLGRGAIGVLDEGEAAGTAGLAIERPHDLGGRADLREMGAQVVFGGLIRQVADEQSH